MAAARDYHRGRILNPHRRFLAPGAIKWGTRQCICILNNPTVIDATQSLLITQGDLHPSGVVVPGSLRLSFEIELISTDASRTLVNNIGRALIKKLTVKFGSETLISLENADVYLCYVYLWKTPIERLNSHYQGIDVSKGCIITKHRVGAADSTPDDENAAVATAFKNKFCVPLDFEMVVSHMPFYQSRLTDNLSFLLKFNDFERVIVRKDDPKARYRISNICREYEVVSHPTLASDIRGLYTEPYTFLYERVHFHQSFRLKAEDWLPDLTLNIPSKSLTAILILFEPEVEAYQRDSERYIKPGIRSVHIVVEGKDHQLYSGGMKPHHQWGRKVQG